MKRNTAKPMTGRMIDTWQINQALDIIDGAVEAAIAEAQKHKADSLQHEAINWGDLHCDGVLFVIDVNGKRFYLATVTEASPNCPDLQAFLQGSLLQAGFENVQIVTAW